MGKSRDSINISKYSIHGYYGSNVCNYSFNCIHIDSVQGNEMFTILQYHNHNTNNNNNTKIDLTNIKDKRLYQR